MEEASCSFFLVYILNCMIFSYQIKYFSGTTNITACIKILQKFFYCLYSKLLPLFFHFFCMEETKPIMTEGLTIDKIIEKFIPVVGALFMTIGLGYLLYTSVWIDLNSTMKLSLGFFLSLVIIGSSYSFSEKLRYFADIGI